MTDFSTTQGSLKIMMDLSTARNCNYPENQLLAEHKESSTVNKLFSHKYDITNIHIFKEEITYHAVKLALSSKTAVWNDILN